jgi:hypothetical protein
MVVFASPSQGIRKVKSRFGECYLNFCAVKIRHKSDHPYKIPQNDLLNPHNSRTGNGLVREKHIAKNSVGKNPTKSSQWKQRYFSKIDRSWRYDAATERNHGGNSNIDISRSLSKFKKSDDKIQDICIFY